jgi:hypothetical protein
MGEQHQNIKDKLEFFYQLSNSHKTYNEIFDTRKIGGIKYRVWVLVGEICTKILWGLSLGLSFFRSKKLLTFEELIKGDIFL